LNSRRRGEFIFSLHFYPRGKRMKQILGLIFLGICLITQVKSWGPISHYVFSCMAYFPSTDVGDCLCNPSNNDLLIGSDMPDIFYFVNWRSPILACSDALDSHMHDPVFAGYQLLFANSMEGQTFKNAEFDPLSFAMGYGAHIFSDFVGFWPKEGYLVGNASYVAWIPEFTFMVAVDAYLYNINNTCTSFPKQPLSQTGVDFFASSIMKYHAIDPMFPTTNDTEIGICTSAGSKIVKTITGLAQIESAVSYQEQLVYFDNFGATTFEQAEYNLQMNVGCAIEAVAHWANDILVSNMKPEDAVTDTKNYILKLFMSGVCSPVN